VSLYTAPLGAVSALGCLTTTSNGQARPIRNFTFESNWNSQFEFESNLEASQVPTLKCSWQFEI